MRTKIIYSTKESQETIARQNEIITETLRIVKKDLDHRKWYNGAGRVLNKIPPITVGLAVLVALISLISVAFRGQSTEFYAKIISFVSLLTSITAILIATCAPPKFSIIFENGPTALTSVMAHDIQGQDGFIYLVQGYEIKNRAIGDKHVAEIHTNEGDTYEVRLDRTIRRGATLIACSFDINDESIRRQDKDAQLGL